MSKIVPEFLYRSAKESSDMYRDRSIKLDARVKELEVLLAESKAMRDYMASELSKSIEQCAKLNNELETLKNAST